MRTFRSDRSPTDPSQGITKGELLEAADISSKTFDMIRKAARVKGPGHGGLEYVFPIEDIKQIIRTAEGGRFTERGAPAAQGWRAMLAERGIEMEEQKKLRGRAGGGF